MIRSSINMFDIIIDNMTLEQACISISNAISNNVKGYVLTPNVDHIVKLRKDKDFHNAYKNATWVFADGMPLVWSSKLLGIKLVEKVSGSDLFPKLCKLASERNHTVFFLGALPGVADKAKNILVDKYPNLQVVGSYSPPFGFETDQEQNNKIITLINSVKPDILFVGVGAPKQEKWIYNNLNLLETNIALGIGASFDFIAGHISRAPIWMQKSGLEWFYRFLQEPNRMFKRYFIEDSIFLFIFFKELFVKKRITFKKSVSKNV